MPFRARQELGYALLTEIFENSWISTWILENDGFYRIFRKMMMSVTMEHLPGVFSRLLGEF